MNSGKFYLALLAAIVAALSQQKPVYSYGFSSISECKGVYKPVWKKATTDPARDRRLFTHCVNGKPGGCGLSKEVGAMEPDFTVCPGHVFAFDNGKELLVCGKFTPTGVVVSTYAEGKEDLPELKESVEAKRLDDQRAASKEYQAWLKQTKQARELLNEVMRADRAKNKPEDLKFGSRGNAKQIQHPAAQEKDIEAAKKVLAKPEPELPKLDPLDQTWESISKALRGRYVESKKGDDCKLQPANKKR